MGRKINKTKPRSRNYRTKRMTKDRIESFHDTDFIVPELMYCDDLNVEVDVSHDHCYAFERNVQFPGEMDWQFNTEFDNFYVEDDNISVSTFESDFCNLNVNSDADDSFIEGYYDCYDSDNEFECNNDQSDPLPFSNATPDAEDNDNFTFSGRRIFDVKLLFEQIHTLNNHCEGFNCGFSDMTCFKELKEGLKSTFHFQCSKCHIVKCIKTYDCKSNSLDINYASVLGAYDVGTGFTQNEEFFANLEIPYMCVKTYDKHQKVLQGDLAVCAERIKKAAVDEEKRMAVEKNEVDINGTPLLTVKIDGSWPKRAYRTSYSSKSGTATLVGFHTGKVIWTGVKNKFCQKCVSDLNRGITTEHNCNTNYRGPPTGMEAELVVEAFKESEEKYGCRYYKIIADGDSKTFKALTDACIYANPHLKLEKLECCLHLYRSSRGRFIIIDKKHKLQSERIIKDIQCARSYWSKQDIPFHSKVERLRKNIHNIPQHVYGNHEHCEKYYCKKSKEVDITNGKNDCAEKDPASKEDLLDNDDCSSNNEYCSSDECCDNDDCSRSNYEPINNNASDTTNEESIVEETEESIVEETEENRVPEMYKTGRMQQIYHAIGRLLDNAKSLMYNYNTNRVEQYNSILNKHLGGKRIDYTKSKNYNGRVDASTIDFNTNRLGSTMLQYKTGMSAEDLKSTLIYKVESTKIEYQSKKERKPKYKKANYSPDENYGTDTCEQAELEPEVFECRKSLILQELERNQKIKDSILCNTVGQANNDLWGQVRSQMITASVFGRICRVRSVKSYKGIIDLILNGSNLDCVLSIRHGKDNEHVALKQFESLFNIKVKPCGIFIDEIFAFLGASPDGLIDEDGLVEVKCPFAGKDETVEEGIVKGTIKFWKTSKKPRIRKTPVKKLTVSKKKASGRTTTTKKSPKNASKKVDRKTGTKKKMSINEETIERIGGSLGTEQKLLATTEDVAQQSSEISKQKCAKNNSKSIELSTDVAETNQRTTRRKKIKISASVTKRKNVDTSEESSQKKKPKLARELDLSPAVQNASNSSEVPFVPEILGINKIHHWYYQIQAQLHIAKRNYCYLIVWTHKNIKVEKIEKDDDFWYKEIEPKVVKFFDSAFLPERIKRYRDAVDK